MIYLGPLTSKHTHVGYSGGYFKLPPSLLKSRQLICHKEYSQHILSLLNRARILYICIFRFLWGTDISTPFCGLENKDSVRE